MTPVEICDLIFCQAGQGSIDIDLLASLIVSAFPVHERTATYGDADGGGKIKAIADAESKQSAERHFRFAINVYSLILRSVSPDIGPSRNQASNCGDHDIGANSGRSCRVRYCIDRHLRVRESSVRE